MTFVKRIVGAAALGATMLMGVGFCAPPADAGYIVTLTQQGSNVVASGSGSLDLTDLTILGDGASTTQIQPRDGTIVTGTASGGPVVFYIGYTGPGSFGSGPFYLPPSSGGGGVVGIDVHDELAIPNNYISGNPLSSTATWNDQSIASLGATPGTYKWTWGSGADADSFVLDVEAAAVPEPGSLLLLALPFSVVLLLVIRRKSASLASFTSRP